MTIPSSSKILTYIAPAKVNLSLQIGNKRADGYHELASIVGFTEFGDHLTLEISNADQLRLLGMFSTNITTPTSKNLVMKAIHTLRNHNFDIPPLRITIDKQIPVGGGLGGGSSDAATIFLALNDIFNLNLKKSYLENIALQVGADVPVCLNRDFVTMRGIGERVTVISPSTKPTYVVLTNPNFIMSTKTVFEEFDKEPLESILKRPLENWSIEQLLAGGNSLEKPAIKIYPQIGILLNTMKSLYSSNKREGLSSVQMSGSGAGCFALFDDAEKANMFCRKIQGAGYWAVSTKFISNF